MHSVLIAGQWVKANQTGSFSAFNPKTGESLPDVYPVSAWDDCEAVLQSATVAFRELQQLPAEALAKFLNCYADKIEGQKSALAAIAALETGLAETPRLHDVELPRTIGQLRQAAQAATTGSWALPTIDTGANIRSIHAAIGPVFVIGPNNFPFAFNGISGGDFAAAIAAGNPVIAKGHPAHPTTSRLLAELAASAVQECGLPAGTVQMLYRTSHADGLRLIGDPRLMAIGFTGSRHAGMAIKSVCDALGKPAYLEMSSVNPVILLPGALEERGEVLAGEFATSCLMGSGQFCTNPGLVVMLASAETDAFIQRVASRFAEAPAGTLLTSGVQQALVDSVTVLTGAGAKLLAGGAAAAGPGFAFQNTLLTVAGQAFLNDPEVFQTEMFGSASLFVVAAGVEEVRDVIGKFEGNLTGTFYVADNGSDDALYAGLAPLLRAKVGRLLNNKMPTGVAVSSAMNHGGPFPATGHAGFTAVGFPATVRRFSMLHCYDGVADSRLPNALRNKNPSRETWRLIDGNWSQGDVAG